MLYLKFKLSFNSIMVRLKEKICMLYLKFKLSFNSIMVRLKDCIRIVL